MNAQLEATIESIDVLPQEEREQAALRELTTLELGLVGGGFAAFSFL